MATSIGDIIVSARASFPDPCGTVAAPSAPTFYSVTGSLTNAQWAVQITAVNDWGESLPSAAANYTVTNGGLGVQLPTTLMPGSTTYNVYFYQTLAVTAVYKISVAAGAFSVGISSLSQASVGIIPTVATAYVPDTDGGLITAWLLYKWISEALNLGSQKVGGYLDYGGIQAVAGQPYYVLDSHWKQVDHAFFDGWPLELGTRDDIFRHSLVEGVSGVMVAQRMADQISVEIYPQPNRTGATTTLNGDITATDTTATVASGGAGNFLPFGICQIGTETVGYGGISGNNLTGLTRGLAGTVPAAWSSGSAVTEFNVRLEGRRDPVTFSVGDSASTLRLPHGMDGLIEIYLRSKFKTAEQNHAEAKDLMGEYMQGMEALMSSAEPIEAPTQLRGGTTDESLGLSEVSRLIIP